MVRIGTPWCDLGNAGSFNPFTFSSTCKLTLLIEFRFSSLAICAPCWDSIDWLDLDLFQLFGLDLYFSVNVSQVHKYASDLQTKLDLGNDMWYCVASLSAC